MFHDEAEIAVARAASSRNSLQILSTVANRSVEDVAAARGASGWLQLYLTSDWPTTQGMLKRAEDAGCTAVAWTVDIPSRNLELVGASIRRTTRLPGLPLQFTGTFAMRPMFDGVNMARVRLGLGGMTWDYVDQLKKGTKMKVLIKGIVTREDAALAIEHGADGVVVSNHGGRSDDRCAAPSTACPRSWKRSAVGSRCFSTAAFAVARTSSRLWRWRHSRRNRPAVHLGLELVRSSGR